MADFKVQKDNYSCNWFCKHEDMKFKHPIKKLKKKSNQSIESKTFIFKTFL